MLHIDPQFRSGFIARAYIFPTHNTRSAVLPLVALLGTSDNRAFVYVYKDGELSKRRIRTGRILDDLIVVMEGIEPGELVVTDGAKYILENTRVNPVNLEKTAEQ